MQSYISELNAFRNWVVLNRPSTGAVALWYTLMSCANSAGWPEWFTVPGPTLQLLTGLSRQGLDRARAQLIQFGLIEYKRGQANRAGKYRLISLADRQKVGTPVGTVVDTQVGTPIDALVDAPVDALAGTNRTHSLTHGEHIKKRQDKDIDKTDQSSSSVSSSALARVAQAYESEIGALTAMVREELIALVDEYPADWIEDAIRQAAVQNVRKLSYIRSILANWRTEGRGAGPKRARASVEIGVTRRSKGGDGGGTHRTSSGTSTDEDAYWDELDRRYFGG